MLNHLGTTVKVGGTDYDISHLAPFIYTLTAAGPDGIDVRKLFDQNGITWEMKDHNQIENMAALAHNPAVRIVRGTHDVILYYFYPSNSEHFEIEMNVLTCHERAVNTNDKHKLDMKQAVRTCYFSKERMPMTEDKRRELAQIKANKERAKCAAKREKRKASKAKKS